MSQFPSSLPDFTDLDPDTSLAANNHAARHNKVHEEVAAIAAKVGIDGSSEPTSLDNRVAGLESSVSDVESDVSALPAAITAEIAAAVSAAKQAMYPVGSIYTNASDNTNPGTLLGFGTWTAFGAGRVIVGLDGADSDFDTAEETGGAKTHTLTNAEMPVHGMSFSHHGDEAGSLIRSVAATGGSTSGTAQSSYKAPPASTGGSNSTQNPGWSWGSGNAHNNLQPYIVVYMWKRTA